MTSPFDRLDDWIPEALRQVIHRLTPIPTIAAAAGARAAKPGSRLVRADIGQISGLAGEKEVLYGPPAGLPTLRKSVAALWNETFGLDPKLDANNVCITTGAASALSLVFQCFAQGRTVALPRGHWENYSNGVEVANGQVCVVDFFDSEGVLNATGLKSAIQQHGAEILVANFPANPTGAVLSEHEAKEIAQVARDCDVLLVVDEVYSRLRFDGGQPHTLIKYAPERAICVSSASKEYLIPGARVGYAICADNRITNMVIPKMVRAHYGSPNVLGQQMLEPLINDDLEDMQAGKSMRHFGHVLEEMSARMKNLLIVLKKHGFPLVGRAGHEPQSTIFLMAGLPKWWSKDDQAFSEAALEADCVSTVPGSAFGLPGAVRFSFGGMTAEAIARLDANLTAFRAEQLASTETP